MLVCRSGKDEVMRCLACGSLVNMNPRKLCIFDWTCGPCGFTLEKDHSRTMGKRFYHYWEKKGRSRSKSVRFLDVPSGCLLVIGEE